jgi:hypothetical protein
VLYTILFQADTNTNGVWHFIGGSGWHSSSKTYKIAFAEDL